MKRTAGFTIVELATTLVIVGVLATALVAAFNAVQIESRDNKRISDALAIQNALERYYDDNNEYPNACPGGLNLGCGTNNIASALSDYTKDLPVFDPSGNIYQYVRATAYNSYGLRIQFENSPVCKIGSVINSSWWGSIPTCTNFSWS